MIHIKIYDKGHDETHIYVKCRCPKDQTRPQLGALLVATCQIARDAISGLDKDKLLQMMSTVWDMEQDKGGKTKYAHHDGHMPVLRAKPDD